ncbi:MAG: hypothetical protein IT323_06345 [Anaerolineae bacterium]|nr:hypothetical protein [Anaerolineae bacterium]
MGRNKTAITAAGTDGSLPTRRPAMHINADSANRFYFDFAFYFYADDVHVSGCGLRERCSG